MDDQVFFCHVVVHRDHIFLQVLPLEDKEYAPENLTGAIGWTRSSVLVKVYMMVFDSQSFCLICHKYCLPLSAAAAMCILTGGYNIKQQTT